MQADKPEQAHANPNKQRQRRQQQADRQTDIKKPTSKQAKAQSNTFKSTTETEIKKISSFREHRCNVLLTATGRMFVFSLCVADVAANDEIFRYRKRTKRQRVYGTTGQATEKAKQTKSKHGNTKIKIGKTFVSLSS